jgi:hypothetical protein
MRLRLSSRIVTAVIIAMAGCSSVPGADPSASPASSEAAWCQRNGGWWRPELNYCEYDRIWRFR